jgi:hypothetical protein
MNRSKNMVHVLSWRGNQRTRSSSTFLWMSGHPLLLFASLHGAYLTKAYLSQSFRIDNIKGGYHCVTIWPRASTNVRIRARTYSRKASIGWMTHIHLLRRLRRKNKPYSSLKGANQRRQFAFQMRTRIFHKDHQQDSHRERSINQHTA